MLLTQTRFLQACVFGGALETDVFLLLSGRSAALRELSDTRSVDENKMTVLFRGGRLTFRRYHVVFCLALSQKAKPGGIFPSLGSVAASRGQCSCAARGPARVPRRCQSGGVGWIALLLHSTRRSQFAAGSPS